MPFEQIAQSATKRLWRQKRLTGLRLADSPGVLTIVISDLHLGASSEADVTRSPAVREPLMAALEGADRLVLLGDVLELRDRPLPSALEIAAPVLASIGEAMAGRPVVVIGGNHDHGIVEPWLAERRLAGEPLGLAESWISQDGVAGRIAAAMPEAEVSFAYPGVWLREDVYAMHGHYLDVHLSVPRIESIAASVMRRLTRAELSSPAGYEAALLPIYEFLYALAQGAPSAALRRGGSVSRSVWSSLNQDGGGRLRRVLLGRVTVPGAVMAMNRLGLGPFRPTLSGEELRRSGLRAAGTVVDGLGIRADHVVFGHTHRAGPLEGDEAGEWRSPAGTRLWNSGTWLYEPVLTGRSARGPYRPGTVLRMGDAGPPEVENVLSGVELPMPAGL